MQEKSVKAVIYARYSSHGQTEQSIEGQLHDAYAWAKQQNVAVIAEYIDRALTGTKDQRPDFQRMVDDAAKRQFSLIIVWTLDRFARNRYDSAIYKARLKKYGVRVVSVKESISDSPEGIILEGLLESMAEYYSANLSQNVRRGLRESADKGLFCGGNVPYGYRCVNQKLIPDEKTAPIIRYVFEQYALGVPKKDIIDELNRRGIRNRNGKPLTYTSFQTALKLPTYIGQHTYKGQVIPGAAEPLISKEVFDKVQQRLALNAHAPAASKARVPYLLQGKVFCGMCGAPMCGESGVSHTGDVHSYYACRTKKKRHACKKRNERREELEQFVTQETASYVLDPVNAKEIARLVAAEHRKEFSSSRADELEKAAARLDREQEKLIDALIDAPKPARAKINARIEALEAQKQELSSDLAKLRIAMSLTITEREVLAWLSTFRDCLSDCSSEQPVSSDELTERRRKLIDTFVNSVFVYDDHIAVFYNIRTSDPVSFDSASGALPTSDQSLENENSKPETGSDLECSGRPWHYKSEPVFVFAGGVFGCWFARGEGGI